MSDTNQEILAVLLYANPGWAALSERTRNCYRDLAAAPTERRFKIAALVHELRAGTGPDPELDSVICSVLCLPGDVKPVTSDPGLAYTVAPPGWVLNTLRESESWCCTAYGPHGELRTACHTDPTRAALIAALVAQMGVA